MARNLGDDLPTSRFLDGNYLITGLPDPSVNSQKYAWCTDLHDSQPDYVISNGIEWKPVRPFAVRDLVNATGAMTLQALKNSPTQRVKSMTGSATVTLSLVGVYSGAKFRVKKEASGILTATVVGLVNTVLPGLTPSWADYEYSVGDGGWFISASGGLLS
jgi:hypothetical protein